MENERLKKFYNFYAKTNYSGYCRAVQCTGRNSFSDRSTMLTETEFNSFKKEAIERFGPPQIGTSILD